MKRSETSRHIIYLLIFSVLALLLVHLTVDIAYIIKSLFTFIQQQIGHLLPTNKDGVFLDKLISMIVTPLVISMAPAGLYWLVTRKRMPGLIALMWGVWLIVLTMNTNV